MKPANAFDRQNLACGQQLTCSCNHVACDCYSFTIQQAQARSANLARCRFRMKTSVERILILSATIVTHVERLHCRVFSIVRYSFDDRETRPAVCAVYEW